MSNNNFLVNLAAAVFIALACFVCFVICLIVGGCLAKLAMSNPQQIAPAIAIFLGCALCFVLGYAFKSITLK